MTYDYAFEIQDALDASRIETRRIGGTDYDIDDIPALSDLIEENDQ